MAQEYTFRLSPMETIINRFSKYLTGIEYPKETSSWNIAGILKNKNAFYKFDVRDMFKLPDGTHAQKSKTNTKADKMVLELKDQWIILDIEELLLYIRKHKVKKVYVNDLIQELEWTIFLPKN